MRRSLGRGMVPVLLIPLGLWGENFQWHLASSPSSMRVGQSAVVRYECRFDGKATEYSVKLRLPENSDYEARILREEAKISQGKKTERFDVIVTPKKSGRLKVALGGMVVYTPPSAIEYYAHLGRDNVSKDDIVTTQTSLPAFEIEALPNTAALTGTFTLKAYADRSEVRAHEPLHLSVIVKGEGNLERFVPFVLNVPGTKVFSEKPFLDYTPSKGGYSGEIRQEFAIVAEKPYRIPSLHINVFDTAENRPKTLSTPELSVAVGEGYQSQLLLDVPQMASTNWKLYALYAALVMLGMVLGEALRQLWRRRPRRRGRHFWDDVQNAKELAVWLSMRRKSEYEPIIRGLEDGSIGLSQAKKKLGTLTQEQEVK